MRSQTPSPIFQLVCSGHGLSGLDIAHQRHTKCTKIQTNVSGILTKMFPIQTIPPKSQTGMQTICLVIQTGTQFRANRLQTNAKPDQYFRCVRTVRHRWCVSTSFLFRAGRLEFNQSPEQRNRLQQRSQQLQRRRKQPELSRRQAPGVAVNLPSSFRP